MGSNAVILALTALMCCSVCGDSKQIYIPEEFDGRLRSVDKDEQSTADVVKTHCHDNIVTIHRVKEKEGFHRNVITDVEIKVKSGVDSLSCQLLQWQSLPPSIYIDTYQVQSRQQHSNTKVLTFDGIDIEKPDYLSPNHTIAVYSKLDSKGGDVLSCQTDLPIHLRYQRPSETDDESFGTATLPLPYLLLHCEGDVKQAINSSDCGLLYEAQCSLTDHRVCQWQVLSYDTEDDPLTFQVPIGNQQYTLLVTTVTMAASILGCLVLLMSMIMSPKSDVKHPHQD